MATIVKGKNANRPWTVRYQDSAHGPRCQPDCTKLMHQREKSFGKKTGPDGADAFKAKYEHDSRELTFVDPRQANEKFGRTAAAWLARHTCTPRTRTIYDTILRTHILPAFGDKRLIDVANNREEMQTFLLITMPANKQGASQIRQAYMVVCAIVNESIQSGKLAKSRIRGITMPATPQSKAADFVFPDKKKIARLAFALPEPYGLAVYVMRGCGLRISEALAVRCGDFRDDGTVLRLTRQMARDGESTIPLKHRKPGDFRDVPVPGYVLAQIRRALPSWDEMPDDAGLFPPTTARKFGDLFRKARSEAKIDSKFTPHSLRHVFASVALANGVAITDVSRWLGHRSIQTTYAIYSHFIPSSWEKAREALDREWQSAA